MWYFHNLKFLWSRPVYAVTKLFQEQGWANDCNVVFVVVVVITADDDVAIVVC